MVSTKALVRKHDPIKSTTGKFTKMLTMKGNDFDFPSGYLLADECYDVWLGNARGNTYSRRHVIFDPDQDKEAFWSFSWNEMGQYDLPANFD